MHPLDQKILELTATKKYLSVSYFKIHFQTHTSYSNLQKRLGKLQQKALLNKTKTLDPISRKNEIVYFLSRKGKETILQFSHFACPDEIDIPKSSSHRNATHELATNYFSFLLEKSLSKYSKKLEYVFEWRRSKIKTIVKGQLIPDGLLKTYANGKEQIFYLELDNNTQGKKVIKEKLLSYENVLFYRNTFLLWIVIPPIEKRLELLLRESYMVLHRDSQKIFGVMLSDCFVLGMDSNIWSCANDLFQYYGTDKENVISRQQDISLRERCFLPLF